MRMDKNIQTINGFIAGFPKDTQAILQTLRETIHKAAPEAKEKISYGIPTFTLDGNLVHFSAYEHHIGFYPGAAPVKEFVDELKPYETSKGTIRFPIDKPLPLALIRKIVKYRVRQNIKKKKP